MQKLEKWTEIYVQLSASDKDRSLEPGKLEKLSLAAYLTGKDAESYRFLERAHQGYLDKEMMASAVQCAFWLGLMLVNAGEKARGGGWFARGERMLKDLQNQECPEKELLLIPRALMMLSEGNAAEAQQVFERVAAAGERFRNADLVALGRLGLGQALVRQGEINRGISLLDETMITIETEEVFPLVNGIVYCAVIETCCNVWDLGRAREWTSALTRWCDGQPGIVPFRGECLVRRAELFQFHGDWGKAITASSDACELLTRQPGRPAAGEAYYRQAELNRLAGDFKLAEESYHEAANRGRNPQPGLALLRMAQGSNDAAETSIRNSLQEDEDPKKRAALLPAMVHILLSSGNTGGANDAAAELCEIARKLNIPYLLAMCAHCQGTVLLAKGNPREALEQIQKALQYWTSLNLPYESACTRELKGRVYLELKDRDTSETELLAAKWIFEQLNAGPDVERVNTFLERKGDHVSYGLSLRELQVLKLVASGKTNRSVADELFISERTVDRHMSNIFNKLDVSSRVEATAFALKNNMLENEQ